MRLYRGFNIEHQEWMYGSLLESWQGKCRIIWEEPTGEMPYPELMECNYLVERDSVGKCLDLKDNSNNTMYEGDYIKSGKGVGEIIYHKQSAMFRIKWHSPLYIQIRGENEPIFPNHEIALRVVGNKYETDLHELFPYTCIVLNHHLPLQHNHSLQLVLNQRS